MIHVSVYSDARHPPIWLSQLPAAAKHATLPFLWIYPLVNKNSNGISPMFNRKYIFEGFIFQPAILAHESVDFWSKHPITSRRISSRGIIWKGFTKLQKYQTWNPWTPFHQEKWRVLIPRNRGYSLNEGNVRSHGFRGYCSIYTSWSGLPESGLALLDC